MSQFENKPGVEGRMQNNSTYSSVNDLLNSAIEHADRGDISLALELISPSNIQELTRNLGTELTHGDFEAISNVCNHVLRAFKKKADELIKSDPDKVLKIIDAFENMTRSTFQGSWVLELSEDDKLTLHKIKANALINLTLKWADQLIQIDPNAAFSIASLEKSSLLSKLYEVADRKPTLEERVRIFNIIVRALKALKNKSARVDPTKTNIQ